jgi:hypothetical protein
VAGTNEVRLTVTAQDKASAALKGLHGNVDALANRFKSLGAPLGILHSRLLGLATAAVAAGSAFASFKTIEAAIKSTEDLGLSVHDINEQTGLSEESASRLIFAFKHVGMEASDAERSLGIFSKKLKGIEDVETGVTEGGKSTAEILADIGIKSTDAEGNLRPMAELLPEVADAFKDMPPGISKTGLAMQLFGRSGRDMIEFLNLGSEGLIDLGKTADKLGVTLDAQTVGAIKKYSYAQRDMKSAIGGLRLEIGVWLMPQLTKLTQWFIDQQPRIREFERNVRDKVTVALRDLGTSLQQNVVPHLRELGDWINKTGIPALRDLGKWAGDELVPRLERFSDWLGTILPGVAAIGGQTLSDIGVALRTLKDAAAGLADWVGANGEKMVFILGGIGLALAWANPSLGIAGGIIGIALAIELMRTNSEKLPKPLLEVQLAILGVTSAVVDQLEVFADIGDKFSGVSKVLVDALPEPLRSVAKAFGQTADAAGLSADSVEESTNKWKRDIDDLKVTAEAQLNSINFREAEQALTDLKVKGDLLPETFASMADTGVASMVTLNQMTTAPIRGDIDKLTSAAHIARDAAKDMVNAWDQALRDSTAIFQEIARHIDEQATALQSLPWTPPTMPSTPSTRTSIPGVGIYAEGGVVPGPFGRPQWGLLHGGEEVIPAGRRGEAVVNNLQMHVTINGTSEEALVKFERLFNDLLRRAGFGGSSISAGAFIPA